MKKRLLSALLALALVFVLLPTTALADTTPVTDANVKINGSAVTVGNDISLGDGNGTYSYDEATHTLTLNSATINATGSNIGISFGVPVKGNINYRIELEGKNTITSTSAQAIYVEHDTSVEAWEKDTMKRSTLTINGSAGSSLNLSVSGSKEAIEAIWSKGDFTLSGGTAVTAFSSGTIAVNVGSMTINNSKLSAQSSSYGTTVVLYGFEMIGDAAEFEALNTSSSVRAVLRTSGASENIDWSKYQLITGSYSGNALTKSEPTVCDKNTLNDLFSSSSTTRYIHIAKRTIPALQRTSDVLIASGKAVVGQWTDIPAATGTGSYYYDAAKKELTLKDVNIASSSIINGIQFTKDGTYTINLVGTNTMSGFSTGISANSDDQYVSNINITITGAGSLEVSTTSYAIAMNKGNLKFENTGEIKLTTSNPSKTHNVLSVSGNITITDMSKYSVTGTQQTGGKPLGSEVSLTEASQLKGGTTGYRIITITPAALEKSDVSVAGTKLYKNTAYTIQDGKPVMGGTYPGNYNIYLDATGSNYVLHVKDAVIEATGNARGTTGIYGTSNIVFEGDNSITASTYGIYSYFTQSDLKISGTGSLEVKTIAGEPAIATAYDTSRSIIISGNGFTVTADTSGTTSYAIRSDNDLTITDGAAVIAKSNATRAIDIKGDLTVTNGSLTATSTSDSVPTVQVGGNASFTGSTVTITNNSTTQGEQYKDSNAASSALHVNGAVTISGGTVTAEAKAGGNAIRAVGNITVSNGATVTAKNNSQYFNAITAGKATGGEVNTLYNLIVSGENTRITATNTHDNKLAYGGAINAYIKNANEGHYLQVGTDTKAIAPNVNTTVRNNSLTITRGDAYTTPQVAANYTIAGQTMYVGKYYKTDANGNITDGTAQDYNIYCDSENDFTLNNATISSTGTSGGSTGVIMTNLDYSGTQIHIKLIGTNSINNIGHHAILGEGENSRIIIENAENASNASLTISGNFLPVYSFGNVTINAEVVIINTNGNLISTNKGGHANGAFDLGSGYKCYASTDVSGSPLETYDAAKSSTYKYLCVTTKTLETGGGSTHQHVWDEAWHDTGDYHHAHQCTICKAYDTTTQELHNVTGHRDNHDGSHSNICGSCGYSAKVSHSYTWAPNANDNEKHIGTCVCGNVVEKNHNFVGDVCSDCGYDKSTGTTCEHVWTTEWTIDTVDNEYHWHKCIKCNAITDKKPHAYTIVTDSGTNHIRECECKVFYVEDHISSDWIIDAPATPTTAGSMHKECTVCKHKMQTEVIPATGEIVPPTPDNPGTIVIIRPAEEEKPAQQPNPSTGANDLVGLAVAAAVAAALGSAALLRKHD